MPQRALPGIGDAAAGDVVLHRIARAPWTFSSMRRLLRDELLVSSRRGL